MSQETIDQLIVNSPYLEPEHYWKYDREELGFNLEKGRRPAGYFVMSRKTKAFDDQGIFKDISLVNRIRPRVQSWRESGYRGVTGITKRLLEYWNDPEQFENRRFFFCQLEAIETLIWLAEAPSNERVGIDINGDGGLFQRLCCKMATGTGKTLVMSMLIAWQILNKAAYPKDGRYSKNILVIAPGLTVKERLKVLLPSDQNNYYKMFAIVPTDFMEKLRTGKVLVHNWHTLSWEKEEKIKKRRSVDKRGALSNKAYIRLVLGEMANAKNLLVVNDEAHHAWRINKGAENKNLRKRDMKDSAEEATVWVDGLDRIHETCGINCCYDFSATPFAPSGKESGEETLFTWIVSDFGLNDAIESGLVKTPCVVVRDDAIPEAATYKSRFFHLYNDDEVKDDLNRRAKPHEPLPDLVRNAYYLLGYDWNEIRKSWKEQGHQIPPVMISVCNRTETAARIKHAFEKDNIRIKELCNIERLLQIDSKVLAQAEEQDSFELIYGGNEGKNTELNRKLSSKERAELLRKQVNTVGIIDSPGEQIQNVISVGMLSEGWDAKTVTHIMGLRAFSSQLLCEQVIGRGLRRTSYDINKDTGKFEAEHVNIFGIPFSFLPYENPDGKREIIIKPKTKIGPDHNKKNYSISWPNVVRFERIYQTPLSLDIETVDQLVLNASKIAMIADLAQTVGGALDYSKIRSIDLKKIAKDMLRTQYLIFIAARDVYDELKPDWKGNREMLIANLVGIVEQFIKSNKIIITPDSFAQDKFSRNLVLDLQLAKIVKHIIHLVKQENIATTQPVYDLHQPIKRTDDMLVWYTSKPCSKTVKSHINVCVYDSTWESTAAYALDHSEHVSAWVKNDHLGFEIYYVYDGIVRKYRPDFIIRLANNEYLVMEIKGQETDIDIKKFQALNEWTEAVSKEGSFGKWHCVVVYEPRDVEDVLAKFVNGTR